MRGVSQSPPGGTRGTRQIPRSLTGGPTQTHTHTHAYCAHTHAYCGLAQQQPRGRWLQANCGRHKQTRLQLASKQWLTSVHRLHAVHRKGMAAPASAHALVLGDPDQGGGGKTALLGGSARRHQPCCAVREPAPCGKHTRRCKAATRTPYPHLGSTHAAPARVQIQTPWRGATRWASRCRTRQPPAQHMCHGDARASSCGRLPQLNRPHSTKELHLARQRCAAGWDTGAHPLPDSAPTRAPQGSW
jgi:hypothetical protein